MTDERTTPAAVSPVAMLLAFPWALAADFAVVALLIRGLHVSRVPAILVGILVAVAAWVALGVRRGSSLRWLRGAGTPADDEPAEPGGP
jgi:hypothetical protein